MHFSTRSGLRWLHVLTLVVFVLLGVTASRAQGIASPLVIPFQGQVTNQQGQLVGSGQYSIIFNLYDVAVGGQPLWTERHSKVGIVNGMVNVFLGSITSLAAVDFSQTRYLGITVDVDDKPTTADPEMVPRQMIIPAFWAKSSENSMKLAGNDWTSIVVDPAGAPSNNPVSGVLNGAKIKDASVTATKLSVSAVQNAQLDANAVTSEKIANGTITADDLATALKQASVIPPGTIVAFGGDETKVPAGWLLCDSSALRSTNALYAPLFAAIGRNFGNGTIHLEGAKFLAIASGPDATDFNLPDLRGRFLRGVDRSLNVVAGRDPDAASRTPMQVGGNTGNAVGSVQSDELKTHNHRVAFQNDGTIVSGNIQGLDSGGVTHSFKSNGPYGMQGSADGSGYTGGAETRPRNAYVNYIIKL